MAEPDLISAYVNALRGSLRARADVDDLVCEVDDHLRCAVYGLEARGREPAAAQREVLARFGEAGLVARSLAMTPSGGSAMPTRITRVAGYFALAAAVTWLAVAPIALVGAGSDDWEVRYAMLALTTFVAAACTTVALVGLLVRAGTGGVLPPVAATVAVMGTLMLGIVTWAWLLGVGLLTIAAIVAVARLRARGLGRGFSGLLLVIAWPIGVALGVALDLMKVGPVDSYGEPYLGQLIGFATGGIVFAAGLWLTGRWLSGEAVVDPSDSMATA